MKLSKVCLLIKKIESNKIFKISLVNIVKAYLFISLILEECLDAAKLNFRNYHEFKTFNKYLECLAKVYPDLVSLKPIGKTTEGRNLKVIKIATPATDDQVKPAVWIDGGIHAREWISPATVLYFIHQLVERHKNALNCHVVEHLDLYILPSANPDGFVLIDISDNTFIFFSTNVSLRFISISTENKS